MLSLPTNLIKEKHSLMVFCFLMGSWGIDVLEAAYVGTVSQSVCLQLCIQGNFV